MTDKQVTDKLREIAVSQIFQYLEKVEKQPLMIKSNAITYAVIDEKGAERWISITIQVPRGSKDEPFNGAMAAEDFEIESQMKEEKARLKAQEKAKKIKADTANRAKAKESETVT